MTSLSLMLYNLIIYPFELIIETISIPLLRTALGLKLIIIGVIVNIVAIPLYNIADRIQKKELDLQTYFKPKLDEIRAVFTGDKRQMIIQTFYRINNYHPIYSLRGLLGLMIQVPIFIAAYKVITSMSYSASFLMIKDLSKPDGLLTIGNLSINILPFVMTAVNIISSLLHTRDLDKKARMPLFIMAGIFLVLLYNSPSALLVYWTTTNLFSLVKNIVLLKPQILLKFFERTKIFWLLLGIAALFAPILDHLQFIAPGKDFYRVVIPLVLVTVTVSIYIIFTSDKYFKSYKHDTKIFLVSITFLTLLIGLFIPSNLISSSPEEFEKPLNIILNTFSKTLGIIFLLPLILYFGSDKKIKKMFSIVFPFIVLFAISNTFIFAGKYGPLTKDLLFSNSDMLIPTNKENILNFSVIIIIALLVWKKIIYKNIFKAIGSISIFAIIILAFLNLYNIVQITKKSDSIRRSKTSAPISKIINLSKNGKNVIVLFFDAASPIDVNYVLKDKPDIVSNFSGFTYYYQTLAFGSHTLMNISPLMGGYEYTPLEMNKRKGKSLKDKNDESIMVVPTIFTENGYESTVIYPTYAGWNWESDISSLIKQTNIKIHSKAFTIDRSKYITNENTDFGALVLKFSAFKISPMILRKNIYKNGSWGMKDYESLNLDFSEYLYMKELTNMVNIVSNTNTYTYFGNEMVHDSFYYDYTTYPKLYLQTPRAEDIKKYDNGSTAKRVYATTRMLLEIEGFCNYLKSNNMYDNTKIIIISDHGARRDKGIFSFTNGQFNSEDIEKLQSFNALLMVKDFDSKGNMELNNNFMTVADMPILATRHLGEVKNPFTKNILKPNKLNGQYPIFAYFTMRGHGVNTFKIDKIFHVKPNIFDTKNWSEISNIGYKK